MVPATVKSDRNSGLSQENVNVMIISMIQFYFNFRTVNVKPFKIYIEALINDFVIAGKYVTSDSTCVSYTRRWLHNQSQWPHSGESLV